jgi:hypothetical protein
MQIGPSGSLPASSNVQAPRPEPSHPRPDSPRAQASEVAREAQKRVPAVAAHGEAEQAPPRRNLPRGTLVNITV